MPYSEHNPWVNTSSKETYTELPPIDLSPNAPAKPEPAPEPLPADTGEIISVEGY